ncbi:uncharacterized protein LOC119686130 [Teleopsis dalmanni]|uniref:uncharacterized protein LOC119686125 n=1 Tax=Teleopsis dalmanni TaxID=139649 RepID=UPI0018CD9702|nr:uncharacterized protein LOC119686125 [Teleopsis dalmanni]XP_037956533.1 uncharacterized protein LOC119686130 [Teleopsis dalmanni]
MNRNRNFNIYTNNSGSNITANMGETGSSTNLLAGGDDNVQNPKSKSNIAAPISDLDEMPVRRYTRTELLLRRYDLLSVEHIWQHEYENDPYYIAVVNRLHELDLWTEISPSAYEPLYNMATLEDCSDAELANIVQQVNEINASPSAQGYRNSFNRRRGRPFRNYGITNNNFQPIYQNPNVPFNYSNVYYPAIAHVNGGSMPNGTTILPQQQYPPSIFMPPQFFNYSADDQANNDVMSYCWYPTNKHNFNEKQ